MIERKANYVPLDFPVRGINVKSDFWVLTPLELAVLIVIISTEVMLLTFEIASTIISGILEEAGNLYTFGDIY